MLQAVAGRVGRLAAVTLLLVADDLIWASRLRAAADRAGAGSSTVATLEELERRLGAGDVEQVIVDLSGRRYDAVDAVRLAAGAGAAVLAVGQHEDLDLRRRALAAGARRVFSYNKLFSDGTSVVADLLSGRL